MTMLVTAALFQAISTRAAEPIKAPEPDRFPLMPCAFNAEALLGNRTLDQAVFLEMKECGFNIAGFALSRAELDEIHAAGMVAYYCAPELRHMNWADPNTENYPDIVERMVAEVGDHPALYGYFLADEPNVSLFANQVKMLELIRQAAPDKHVYVNLLPNYAPLEAIGTQSYREYLDRFIRDYRPERLGLDYYALMHWKDRQKLQGDYWLNLEEAREASLAAGIPLAMCTLAIPHLYYRQPTEDDLYFEVFSALLYGVQGFDFFTYFTPDSVFGYRQGPINEFGRKTPTWYALQNVLSTVHVIADLCSKLQSSRVYHIPQVPAEKGTRPADKNTLIASFDCDPEFRFAVGEFKHTETGDTYVMIMNKNLDFTRFFGTINWNRKPSKIETFNQRTGKLRPFRTDEGFLPPGKAVILKLTF